MEAGVSHEATIKNEKAMQKEVRVELDAAEGEEVMKATITVTTTKNGESTETTEVIMGTKEEIEATIQAQKEIDMEIHTEHEE